MPLDNAWDAHENAHLHSYKIIVKATGPNLPHAAR